MSSSNVSRIVAVVVLVVMALSAGCINPEDAEAEPPNATDLDVEESETPPGTSFVRVNGTGTDAGQINVEGGVVAQDVGDTWDNGETLVVFPLEEEIRLVWSDNGQERVLYDGEGFLPPVTYGVDRADDVTVTESPTYNGVRSTDGSVTVSADTEVFGRVSGYDGVELRSPNAVVYRGVRSEVGDVMVREGGAVYDSVVAGDSVRLTQNVYVDGSVVAEGDSGEVSIDAGVEVTEDVEATGNDSSVTIREDGVVNGSVVSDDDAVFLKDNITVDGNVTAAKSVDIGAGSSIGGDIDAGDGVTVREDTVVEGDITADGEVSLNDNVTVEGTVTAGSLSCGQDVTINGEACNA